MRAVLYPNPTEFNTEEPLVLNHLHTKFPTLKGIITKWDNGLTSNDSEEMAMAVDSRVDDFNFSYPVIEIDEQSEKWIKNVD